jgi:hypothetical protein
MARNPDCKTAVNRVTKTIRRMALRKALEWWEIGNCEVTPQIMGPIAKSLIKRDGPEVQIAAYDPLGLKCHPLEKTNVVVDFYGKVLLTS